MNPDITGLIGAQRAEFAKAAALRMWMVLAQIMVAATAGGSVFVDDGRILLVCAAAGVLTSCSWLVLGLHYQRSRASSGRARRATLIMAGLGESVSHTELLSIRSALTVNEEDAGRYSDPAYFASKAQPGWKRLGEMLQESAFWTAELQGRSASIMWVSSLLSLTASLIAFSLVLAFGADTIPTKIARVVIAIVALLVSSDIVGAAFAHAAAKTVVERIVIRLADAEGRGYPQADLLLLFGDYTAAVEAAPIAVPFLYELSHVHLERLFTAYQASRERAP